MNENYQSNEKNHVEYLFIKYEQMQSFKISF